MKEEDQMYQQDKTPFAAQQAAAPSPQEFYLPLGGGTDPDFFVPEERIAAPGRLSRWILALPGFGRQR
ncbi:hypothetical protein [Pseudarthrobacter sp. NPDC058119]|uniref:hypothetical protein n=1 Tax=Pseudarthrobacter sp. NPDC058119 TaxID=3346348 RepID=UPI0036D8AE7F